MPDNGDEPEFVGGHVLLDFVNTIAWRLDSGRTVDRIPDCAALLRWAAAAELIDVRQWEALRRELDVDPAAARSVAAKARSLREAMYRLLEPVATGRAPSREDVIVVRHVVIDALTRGEIDTVVPLRWTVPLHALRSAGPALDGGLAATAA